MLKISKYDGLQKKMLLRKHKIISFTRCISSGQSGHYTHQVITQSHNTRT